MADVAPRLLTADVGGLVKFLRQTFGPQVEVHPDRPAELRIGDSVVLVSDRPGNPIAVANLPVRLGRGHRRRAIAVGAHAIEPPADMPYGDRRATLQAAWRNTWQLATYRRA